jgi:hypothetical protein
MGAPGYLLGPDVLRGHYRKSSQIFQEVKHMFTLQTANAYRDTSKYTERKRRTYLTNRDKILEAAATKRRALKALGEQVPEVHTEPRLTDPDQVEDIRPMMERNRREVMEGIRLRLIWASSAGGDEGTVAKTAVAVIRFAEMEGGHWTDRALRALHRRLSLAEGLTGDRFEAARNTLSRELFVPL